MTKSSLEVVSFWMVIIGYNCNLSFLAGLSTTSTMDQNDELKTIPLFWFIHFRFKYWIFQTLSLWQKCVRQVIHHFRIGWSILYVSKIRFFEIWSKFFFSLDISSNDEWFNSSEFSTEFFDVICSIQSANEPNNVASNTTISSKFSSIITTNEYL